MFLTKKQQKKDDRLSRLKKEGEINEKSIYTPMCLGHRLWDIAFSYNG